MRRAGFNLIEWFHSFLSVFFDLVESWGYLGVIFLMALESSIFPVPSEVVIPPAAYWAVHGKDGGPPPMTMTGVILAGTFGSWLGSTITYLVARWVGRPVVLRWGKYFFCPPEKLARAERFLERYEAGAIFFARLLPVVRAYAESSGCGVLLVEQHVHLALEVCDRGYVLSHGDLVLHRPASELRANRQLIVSSYLGEQEVEVPAAGAEPSAPAQSDAT